MDLICYNGLFYPAAQPVLTVASRAYCYGDGIFETIRINKGSAPLAAYHFKRLFDSIRLLQINPGHLTEDFLMRLIAETCSRNHCADSARVRLEVFRGANDDADFSIQAIPLEAKFLGWNEKGLSIDIYPGTSRAADQFSSMKSVSYLPYAMAARYAVANNLDDVLVLNTKGGIADSSRANLFIIKDQKILTPSTDQGCISGVMRSFLIEKLYNTSQHVEETALSVDDLDSADEIFLTNALQGIRWVERFRGKSYSASLARSLYEKYCQPFV